jgi:ferredoxin
MGPIPHLCAVAEPTTAGSFTQCHCVKCPLMTYVINEPCIGVKDNSCVEACPIDAITSEDQVPEEWRRFVEINAAYFRNRRT